MAKKVEKSLIDNTPLGNYEFTEKATKGIVAISKAASSKVANLINIKHATSQPNQDELANEENKIGMKDELF